MALELIVRLCGRVARIWEAPFKLMCTFTRIIRNLYTPFDIWSVTKKILHFALIGQLPFGNVWLGEQEGTIRLSDLSVFDLTVSIPNKCVQGSFSCLSSSFSLLHRKCWLEGSQKCTHCLSGDQEVRGMWVLVAYIVSTTTVYTVNLVSWSSFPFTVN